MKALIFDIRGDFGFFRKYYTTTSPLTFSFPPPPTVRGILGAIYGVDRQNCLNVFSGVNSRVAIGIRSPIKKVRFGTNYINTKGSCWTLIKKKGHEPHSPVLVELVKDACYRIYFSHNDPSVYNDVLNRIETKTESFTVSLGGCNMLADVEFVGEKEFEECGNGVVDISTVIPFSLMKDRGLKIEEGKKYFKELMPIDMDADRVVHRYEDVIFEVNGKEIKADMRQFWRSSDGECIAFF